MVNYIRGINRRSLIIYSIAVVLILISCAKDKPYLINKISSDSFSIIVLPDTQFYSKRYPETYYRQTQWIVDHRDELNIKFVIHLGDITHNNTHEQWKVANKAHMILDKANIAYSMVPGNHEMPKIGTGQDRERNTTKYNKYFGPGRFSEESWYGGHMGTTNDNNFTFFEWKNLKFMVISLEFAPRDEALEWANKVIAQYKERRVIVVTHCYLDMCEAGNTGCGRYRNDCSIAYNLEGNAGDTLWEKFVSKHKNIFMVLSGHVTDDEHITRKGGGGNDVHEILTDYQNEVPKQYKDTKKGKRSGNGWLRVLLFNPKENKIHVSSLSVDGVKRFYETERYNKDPSHSDHTYSFHYVMNTSVP